MAADACAFQADRTRLLMRYGSATLSIRVRAYWTLMHTRPPLHRIQSSIRTIDIPSDSSHPSAAVTVTGLLDTYLLLANVSKRKNDATGGRSDLSSKWGFLLPSHVHQKSIETGE